MIKLKRIKELMINLDHLPIDFIYIDFIYYSMIIYDYLSHLYIDIRYSFKLDNIR